MRWAGTLRLYITLTATLAVCAGSHCLAAEDPKADPVPAVGLKLTEVKLPGAAEAHVAVGGGGRYLVFHFKDLRKLGVFDIKARKMVGLVSAADDQVTYTAGKQHFVVHLGVAGMISRYRLDTLEREKSVPLAAEVIGLGMGSATNGPLIVVQKSSYDGRGRLFDLNQLQPIETRIVGRRVSHTKEGAFEIGVIIHVSADGRFVGGTRTGVSPSGVYLAVIEGNTVEVFYEHNSWGLIRPSPNGNRIYGSNAVYSARLTPLNQRSGYAIPELTKDCFELGLQPAARGSAPTVRLHVQGDSRPLLRFYPEQLAIDEVPPQGVTSGNAAWHQRLFLNTAEKALVAIPADRQRLILADFDALTLLNKSGRDYLFVTSQPSTSVKPGEPWSYKVETRAKHGPVTMKLESGPEDMTLDRDGELRWKMPAKLQSETIVVSIKDAKDQEIFHTFKLSANPARSHRSPADPRESAEASPR